jgi:hypothetical protein
MVNRWWAELHPATAGLVRLPPQYARPTINPLAQNARSVRALHRWAVAAAW